ncbi:MAG: SGNH/GDSL hydrolase family protein [Kiritimatiellae bacterium]|nr:SGNH/GDSL hydrolase family protein [Kiritimatiellia bacterium]
MSLGRSAVSEIGRLLRRAPGLMVIVPLVVLFFGSFWLVPLPAAPSRVKLFSIENKRLVSRDVKMPGHAEGSLADGGVRVRGSDVLVLEYPRTMRRLVLGIQLRGEDRCTVGASLDGGDFSTVWQVKPSRATEAQWATRRTELTLNTPIRLLQLRVSPGTEEFTLSDVRVKRLARISHDWLVLALWLAGLLAAGLALFPRAREPAETLGGALERADLPLSVALTCMIVFELNSLALFFLALLVGLVLLFRLGRLAVRRLPWPALLFNALFLVLFFRFAPALFEKFITYRTVSEFQLDVDHRMKPNPELDVNLDGIRFKGGPADVRDEDFNIIFMGDSFTYGMKLPYDDCVPYVLERLATNLSCAARIRSVNFGWVSSSPLLSYRLLMDIGRKYKPDLAVFLLDVTDFHDDLKYALKISEKEGVRFSSSLLLDNALDRLLLRFMTLGTLRSLKEQFRAANMAHREKAEVMSVMKIRYYATNVPLVYARPYFEKGVMANLLTLQEYCRDHLGVPLAVVLVPRAYQYSDREVPRDYEADLYTIRGPHVRNPNRYFAERKDRLPYPFLDLLPAFEASGLFPLYFEDDPHWNRDGALLASRTILDFLAREKLLPCGPVVP